MLSVVLRCGPTFQGCLSCLLLPVSAGMPFFLNTKTSQRFNNQPVVDISHGLLPVYDTPKLGTPDPRATSSVTKGSLSVT